MSKATKTKEQLIGEIDQLRRMIDDFQSQETSYKHLSKQLQEEINDRKKAEHALEERLRFETLIAGLSAKFVNLPADQVDKEIEEGVRQIVKFMGVDRGSVLDFSEDRSELRVSHAYAVAGVHPVPVMEVTSRFPWLAEKLRRGETICIGRPDELPKEAESERQFILEEGQKAVLMTPLKIGGSILGALTVGSLKCEHSWSAETILRLQLVGEVFGNALMRMRTEHVLRESEKRFRAIVEDQTELICRNLPDGTIIFVNDAYCRCFGKSRDELVGHEFMPLIPEEDHLKVQQHFASLGPDNPVATHEHRVIMPNGAIRWQQWTNRVIFDDAVNVIEFQGAGRDITDRKEAEKGLRKSEEKFHKAFYSSPNAIVISTLEKGQFIDVNEAATRTLGYTSEEIIGKTSEELKIWAIAKDRDEMVEALSRDGKIRDQELRFRHKSGDIRDIVLSAETIDLEGENCIVVAAKDITERKQAEKNLREKEQQQRQILDTMADGLAIIGEGGQFLYVNAAHCRMYQYSCEEFLKMKVLDILHPDSYPVFERYEREISETGYFSGETLEFRKDGTTMNVEVTGSRIHFGGRECFLAILQDITERKQAEQKLLDYQEQLRSLASELSLSEERQRHHIATELHDTVSQEIAFALTKLQNIRETASGDNPGSLSDVCGMMSKVVANMRNLTFDICSPTLYKFDLETAVSELLDDKFIMRDEINYSFRDDRKPKPLSEDIKIVLFQSIRELVNNIMKHAQAHNVMVDIQRRQNTIRITVNDDGVGFNAEELKLPERSRGGFGLFSIAERLKYIGGSFELQAQPGRGSSFTLEAPLETDAVICKGEDNGGEDINC